MKPMLFITKLDLGGMERFCVTLCNEWTAQGRAFLLYVSYGDGATQGAIQAQDQIFVANQPARYAAGRLLKLCRANADEPALVLSLELGAMLLILKWLSLIKNKIIVRESTAVLSHCSWFWRQIYRYVIARADGFIVQSRSGRSDLEALFAKRDASQPMQLIYSPCAFIKVPSQRSFLPRNGDTIHLLMVGRLAPMKGHTRLLQAIKSIRGSSWLLTIVGDGECRTAIQDETNQLELNAKVSMAGSQQDVRAYYGAADVFVIASEYEGLPNTLIEALACGCRVLVAAGAGGTSEFMNEIGLGEFVFEADDFDENFEMCLNRVLKSDIEMWKQAHERMAALVRPCDVAEQVWGFLESG